MHFVKAVIFILILFVSLSVDAAEPSINELRNLFYQSKNDRRAAELLCKKLERTDRKAGALILAYKGIGRMMYAKHSINPYTKLVNFNAGKNLLEEGVRIDAANAEVRFLRYCIQTQIPAVLCYYSNKDEDKALLLRAWKTIVDEDLKQRIRAYLVEFGNCSSNEKMKLI